MQVRLNSPFRMHQTPSDIDFNAFVNRLYPKRPAVRYGMGFSCGAGYVASKNSAGADICVIDNSGGGGSSSSGPSSSGSSDAGCQDFYTWTAQSGMEDCGIYCNSSGCDQQTATACNQRNNNRAVAIQQIQQTYSNCVPQGASLSINSQSGQWSVSKPPAVVSQEATCPNPNNPNCCGDKLCAPGEQSLTYAAYVSKYPNGAPSSGGGTQPAYQAAQSQTSSNFTPPQAASIQQPASSQPIYYVTNTYAAPPSNNAGAVPAIAPVDTSASSSTIFGMSTTTLMLIAAGVGLLLLTGKK